MMARAAGRAFRLARWLIRLELMIWRSLFFWAARRVPGRGPRVRAFPYAKEVSPVLGAFVFVSALEIPVAHILIPWDAVRLAFLIVGVWGLLWMIGFLASVRVFQHLIDDSSLRVRHATWVDFAVRWEDIETVRAVRGSVPTNRLVHIEDGERGVIASVAVLKQTRVAVVLRRPTSVALPDGPTVIDEIRLYVDDPPAFVAAARERVAARSMTADAA